MKKILQQTALLTAAFLLLTGCSEKEPDFATEEELPYGATMRSDKNSYAVPVTYDRRFLEEDQIRAATDFLGAIQNKDAELYQSSTFDFYADYQLEEVYSYEDMQSLVNDLHGAIAKSTAEDFQFNMVLINSISDNRDMGGLLEAFTLCEGISGEENFADTVQNAWDFTVEWDISYHDGAEYSVIDEQHLFVFQTADGCFCMM